MIEIGSMRHMYPCQRILCQTDNRPQVTGMITKRSFCGRLV
nr:hypothetical protein [Kibdelosporangium sp. MJ126-NF4]CTQ98265.1 hypothetical protein [Kibdelosporangium sp. MJ126-NF4]